MSWPLDAVRVLEVDAAGALVGQLSRRSQYEFDYQPQAAREVSLLMPRAERTFRDNELFAVMDMNLPEGFLLAQIRERFPKEPPTKMQLLALMGGHGIGWNGFRQPGEARGQRVAPVSRSRLLRDGAGRGGRVFADLVEAYLSTGAGLSGVQPKIIVPERASIPTPNLIVKAGGPGYPGLSANEFLCLEVARRAGLAVPSHELSDDGALLVVERFDLGPNGARLGFEDIAALLDLRVGGALSDRKYRGSYEDVAAALALFVTDVGATLREFFRAVALTVLVRNGDGHLKNFGVLYDGRTCGLAPVFDVVTTTLYAYERASGERVTDRTMALRLRKGREARTREYPGRAALLAFGQEVCGVEEPAPVVEALSGAMAEVLEAARSDERIPRATLAGLRREWTASMATAA